MPATVTSLAARRRSSTIEDAVTSLHAAEIASYLLAVLRDSRTDMDAIRQRAARIDAQHPGYPSLVDQLDALNSSAA